MKVFLPPSVVLLLCFATSVRGYVYTVPLNTDNGFCEYADQSVQVGFTVYDDDACEKYTCSEGNVEIAGCNDIPEGIEDDPLCRVVTYGGSYPGCCTMVMCA